jgi:hypothetical protein
MRLTIPENVNLYTFLAPAADGAGRTSAYHSLKGAVKAWIVFHVTQGNAATILLSPLQATAVAGTSSKAISACRIWTKLTAAATYFTKQTEAATYTTDAGVDNKVVVLELDCAKVLDIANGFDCIAMSTGASNAANITSALLIVQPHYQGIPEVNALTD